MAINAMENQGIDPNSMSGWSKVRDVGLALVGGGIVIFLGGYGIKAGYNHFSVPAPVAAIVEKVSAPSDNAPTGYQNYYANGKRIQVKMCTAVSDECGSMEQGKPADYGTGYHTSADGRTRPNPPAGWQWSGK